MGRPSERGRHQCPKGRRPLPGPSGRTLQPGVKRIEAGAMPRVCHDAPAPLQRVVLAMVRGRRGATPGPLLLLYHRHPPRPAWGPGTMICWAIRPLEAQRRHGGTPRAAGLPPLPASGRHAVPGHLGSPPLHHQCLERREQEAHRGERGRWLTGVLDRCDQRATFAPTRAGPPFHRGCGLPGEA